MAARVDPAAGLFLNTRSVALVGVSADVSKFGGRLLRNLLKRGFPGAVHVVHPKAADLMGVRCVPTLSEVPAPVDLVVVALPRERVADLVAQCSRIGARALLVFTSGYAETGPEGEEAQDRLAALARAHDVRLLGPNCLGLYDAHARIALSANEALDRDLRPGPVAIVSQSGALIGSLLDRGEDMGVHFAGFVNTGNEADLDAADFLAYFAGRPETRVLLAYLEAVRDWGKLRSALEAAAEAGKPVVILRAGRTRHGQRVALSHTGALAGDASGFDALLRKHGAVGTRDIDEALDLALLFASTGSPARSGIALVSVSGGFAGLAADRCVELGLEVPDFSPRTLAALRGLLPSFATPGNPLDVTGAVTSTPGLLEQCAEAVAHDESVGLVAILLTMVYGRERLATEILRARDRAEVPLVAVWSGGRLVRESLDALREGAVVTFESLERALQALRAFEARARWRAHAKEPARSPFTTEQVRRCQRRLQTGPVPRCLTEYESKQVLAELGLGIPREQLANDPDQAAAHAAEIGFPVALKVMSPDLPHKVRSGAIALNVASADEVARRSRELLETCSRRFPGAEIHGILVQEMLEPTHELILGMVRQPGLGPLMMVGMGGTLVETLGDVAFRLAPLSRAEADEMVQELRGAAALCVGAGPPNGLIEALVRASWLAHEATTLVELDINPIARTPSGAWVVLDALMSLGPWEEGAR